MEFIDNSGHIFSLNDYNSKPIGYEFEETPYTFWINDANNNSRLSINTYYGKVINVLYELDDYDLDNDNLSDYINIEINLDSKIFKFIKGVSFQDAINSNQNLFDYVSLHNNEVLTSSLNSNNDDDICVVTFHNSQNDKCYALIPIYVIGITDDPGTWSSNILLHIYNDYKTIDKWCNFCVGGTFVDEYECLEIHGKNMGVNLPKDILKAVYAQSFYEETFNEELYNKKLKEYMLNYMGIKGEKGNYNSAIQSLKWFGYGKNLTLYKLLKNDNDYIDQYIRDDFNIYNDILDSYKNFLYTKFVSISFKINDDKRDEDGNIIYNEQYLNEFLYGEGNPQTVDLFNKTIIKETPEYFQTERFKYLDSYYKYSFYELSFKLSALVYFYTRYFLPAYIHLKNLTLEYKVYANNVKFDNFMCKQHFYEHPIVIMNEDEDNIIFPKTHILYFYNQTHVVDKDFNEIINYNENQVITSIFDRKEFFENFKESDDEILYEINDSCIYVPIYFKENKYYNCVFYLYDKKTQKQIYSSNFNFYNIENKHNYNGFVFYPKFLDYIMNQKNKNMYNVINNEYVIYMMVNNTWFTYEFEVRIPLFNIDFGTIEYKYWINDVNYLNQYYTGDESKILLYEYDKDGNNINENEESNSIDLTDYIKHKDYFDNPIRYMSKFNQIKTIDNDHIQFKYEMHDVNFININDEKWGFEKDIQQLVESHSTNINLGSNNKLLNQIHIYDLYECHIDSNESKNEIKFNKNIKLKCGDYIIEHNATMFEEYNNNEYNIFTITGGNINSNYNSIDGVDNYLWDNPENIYVQDNKVFYYYYVRGVDSNGKYINYDRITTNKYTKQLTGNKLYIGYVIYKQQDIKNGQITIDNIKDKKFDTNFDSTQLYIKNGQFIYTDQKSYIHPLLYKMTFTSKNILTNEWEDVESIDSQNIYEAINNNNSKYYIKLSLYEQEYINVLNAIHFITDDEDIFDKTTNTININGERINALSIDNLIKYSVYNDNPSICWYSGSDINDINNIIFDSESYINSYEFIENENEFELQGDNYLYGVYSNYICKNLTGLEEGEYKFDYETSNDNVKVCILIKDNNDQIFNYYNPCQIKINGDEKYIYMYFSIAGICENIIVKNISLRKFNEIENHINYSINDGENINLYKDFFYKKYEIKKEEELINEIWESNCNISDKYDIYIMHNETMYYVVFISKDTCQSFTDIKELNKHPESINYEGINSNKTYRLRYLRSHKSLLINRLYLNSSNGKNQFSINDVIGVSIKNNNMLPLDVAINSKWKITPVSFGTTSTTVINGIGNTAIISVPKNNLNYGRGYYEVTVNYKLNNSSMNYQTIKSKILIK